ncbi:MAG: hypothetical protein HUU45_11550, partial [Leptospiraceae bacterium]|nr:hypothetical protein [Leptospiraceae bacterium]
MTLDEIKELNRKIQSIPERKNLTHCVFVDNLHSPYAEFSETYILPPVSHNELDFLSAEKFIDTLIHFLPESISGCSVLPEPRPKRESGKLFLVKKLYNDKFLYIIKFEPSYLGGVIPNDIIEKETLEKKASILTNRIYFSIRIIPVEKIIEKEGQIIDFQGKIFEPGNSTLIETNEQLHKGKKKVSELFDEIDFSDQIQNLNNKLLIHKNNWKPEKVYHPISIEYLTVSVRFLNLSQKQNLSDFDSFK